MKALLRKLFYLSLLLALLYSAFLGFKAGDGSKFWIVEDLRSGSVSVYHKKYNFVWQALVPAWFSVSEHARNSSFSFDLKIPFIDFPKNSPDYYCARFSVNTAFALDPAAVASAGLFSSRQDHLRSFLKSSIEKAFFAEFARFLRPAYRPFEIDSSRDLIIKNINDRLKKDLSSSGIGLVSINYTSAMQLPDQNIYAEGLDHLAKLRRSDIAAEMEMRAVSSRMEREGLLNEQYYKKLLRIADIINGRPDILKYIYIDKLSDNVKVVISPDKTGVPLFLENESAEKQAKKGSIDNLR